MYKQGLRRSLAFNLPGVLLILLEIIVFSGLVSVQNLNAQSYQSREGDSINPRFYASMGYYVPNIRTNLRIDGSRLGTDISLEDTFNLDEDLGVFRADFYVSLTKRSSLVGSYTSIKRGNSIVLEEDFEFEDVVFEAGSGVRFNFDVDYIAATYRYNLFNELNMSAGFSAGLRGVIINTGATARLNSLTRSASASFLAPALLLGVHYSAYLRPRLLLRYSLEGLYLEIEDIRVNIIESNASINYFITKKVGVGLSYSTNNYRVRNFSLGGDFNGKVNFSFGGLNMSLIARF